MFNTNTSMVDLVCPKCENGIDLEPEELNKVWIECHWCKYKFKRNRGYIH